MLTATETGLAPARAAGRTGRSPAFRRVLPYVEAGALVVALAVPFVLGERTSARAPR